MKKIFTLLLVTFLLTGCSINYNLEIDEDINETLEYEVTESEYNEYNNSLYEVQNADLYEFFEYQPILVFKDNFSEQHKYEKDKIKNGLKLKYSYKYDFKNYGNSYIVDNCFDKYSFVNDNDYYYVRVSGKFKCYYEKTNINVKTSKKMIYNNADSYDDGFFKWIIDDKNKNNVDVAFQISKNEPFDKNDIPKSIKKPSYFLIVFIFVLIVAAIVGLMIVKKKGNSND